MNQAKKNKRQLASLISLLLVTTFLLAACGGDSGGQVAPQTNGQTSTDPDPGPPGIALLAGSLGGPGDNDGTGNLARFNNIKSFTADASGNLYVTTSDRNTNGLQAIRKVSKEGVVTTLFSSQAGNVDGDRTVAKISNPDQIAVDSKANVFFIDDNGVRKLSNTGMLTTLITLNKVCPNDLFECKGFIHIFQDALFVFDTNVVYRFDQDGRKSIFAGQRDETASAIDGVGSIGRFAHIVAVSLESDLGFILFDQGKIRRLSVNTEVTTVADAGAGNIYNRDCISPEFRELMLNSQKEISFIYRCTYVPSFGNPRYTEYKQYKLNSSGKFIPTANIVLLPNGLWGTWPENTYLILKNEIWFKDATGKELLFAGLNEEQILKDGTASEARFKEPKAIAADLAGNVYIAENPKRTFVDYKWTYWIIDRGLTIRKISRDGDVTTLNNPTTPAGLLSGIALDRKGNIYVSSTESASSFFPGIYKMSPTGEVSVFAGAASTTNVSKYMEGVDGLAEQASFSGAVSLLGFDREGNLYANDRKEGKATIRKITKNGLVSTIDALPTGFGADELGNVYSIGADQTSIMKTGLDNKVTLVAGATDNHSLKLGPLPGNLSYIKGLARTGPKSFAVLNDARVLKLVIP